MLKKAIILFSGGIDSTTTLMMAKAEGYLCHVLSFNYGQKHSSELLQAKKLAQMFGVVEHRILSLPLAELGGSSLTQVGWEVADFKSQAEIPATYVPARNIIFLSLALAYAETISAYDIFIGANIIDYSNYPDCRPEFLSAFEHMANLGTKAVAQTQKFKIHAPLLHLSKAEIIKTGMKLGIDYSQTISCYRANTVGEACGTCDSCVHRQKGFSEANLKDPTRYFAAGLS